MKTVGAIKHKLNQVRFRYLKKCLEAELRQSPCNCRYNVAAPSYVPGNDPPWLCLYGAEDPLTWVASICDERFDQGARARECPVFCAKRTKDEVKAEFQQKLDAMTLPEVAFHYPDMAALIWVLDVEDVGVPEEVPVPPPPVEVVVVPDEEVLPVEAVVRDMKPSEIRETVNLPVVADVPKPEEKKTPWYYRLLGVG